MAVSLSERVLATPSAHAKEHYLYVQEIGTLTSMEPHISARRDLNSYLFLIVTDGLGTFTYGRQKYEIEAGDCVFISCRSEYSHESSADHPWTLMWVHFNGNQAATFYGNYLSQDNTNRFHPITTAPYTDILTLLFQAQKSKSPHMELLSHKYLTDLITLCFTGCQSDMSENDSLTQKLSQIRSFLEEHHSEKISLEDLSRRFFISKFYLSREYKRIYGITLCNDLNSRRISHAKALLRFSGDSVEQIAAACGFQDAGYFIKVFRRSENMTPLQYRRKW